MTERPVDEIRVGDRVYLSAGPRKGDIIGVHAVSDEVLGDRAGSYVSRADGKPLRILQAGDVIPAGARYSWVQADGTLGPETERSADCTVTFKDSPRVILSMPTPEPSREEQRAKLVEAHRDAMSAWMQAEKEMVSAAAAVEKFDAEGARTNRRYREDG